MPDSFLVAAGEITGGLDTLKTVYEWIMAGIATVCTTIATTPLLLLPVGLFMAGGMIGLSKRFIGR